MRKILLFLSIPVVLACSKDRLLGLEGEDPLPSMGFVSEIPQDILQKTEIITIKSDLDIPFITKKGSKIYIHPKDFNPVKGKAVTYPFRLEVTELLSIKDMILNEKPTVSNGRLLSTDGQMLIKAYKDDNELSILKKSSFYFIMSGMTAKVDPNMMVFLGEDTKAGFNWLADSISCRETPDGRGCGNISTSQGLYFAFPSSLGWINCDKFADYGNTTFFKFESEISLDYVRTFVFFPDLRSIMQIHYKYPFHVPIGHKAKIISYAFNDNEEVFTYFEDVVIRKDHEIKLNLVKSSKEELVQELEKL